jgi:hypothetical protein
MRVPGTVLVEQVCPPCPLLPQSPVQMGSGSWKGVGEGVKESVNF